MVQKENKRRTKSLMHMHLFPFREKNGVLRQLASAHGKVRGLKAKKGDYSVKGETKWVILQIFTQITDNEIH